MQIQDFIHVRSQDRHSSWAGNLLISYISNTVCSITQMTTIEIHGDATEYLKIFGTPSLSRLVVNKLTELGTVAFLNLIPSLPGSIQEINVLFCTHLVSWPDCKLPASLKTLRIIGSKIKTVPNLQDLIHLEDVDLHDNHIGSITSPWLPPQVVAVDLSYNMIYTLDWTTLPADVASVNVAFNFLQEAPPPGSTGIKFDHNQIDMYSYCRHVLGEHVYNNNDTEYTHLIQKQKHLKQSSHSVYNHKQSVHDTAIQSGARDALNKIRILSSSHHQVLAKADLVKNVQTTLYPKTSVFSYCCCCSCFQNECSNQIKECCNDEITLYAGQVTYCELLGMVWSIIENHEHRESLRERLREELEEGHDMCFTGRATRILNSLQGIVDGIHIGVSEREALQARITAIIGRRNKSKESESATYLRKELADVLDGSYKELMDGERDAWLQAFDEL